MFQWKNIQLSSEDYQNYVLNQDEAQMRVNNLNISAFQWSQLYQQVQKRSLQNKAIKKCVLAYQGGLKRLLAHGNGQTSTKEIQKMYEKQNNELRIFISQLYDQINLLHIRNISTTVEFSFSRLLNLQQQLINIICSQQSQISALKAQNERLQVNKNSQLCAVCFQETFKNRNKLLVRQVLACDQSAQLLEEIQRMELSQPQKVQKISREQAKRQENEYEIERLWYLNSVQEVLKNRQKIMKCNSAPLQNLLSQYLTQILQMLEECKMPFSQKNIKQYDRVNKSYESIDDMKASINTDHFYKQVSLLLQKPYQNLVDNIERYVKSSKGYKGSTKTTTVQTQTTYLTEIEHTKSLQKKINQLNYELQHIKQSKSKNQLDLINHMESLHRIQVKYMESVNKNKNLEVENKRLESDIQSLKNQLKSAKEAYHSDQNRIIQINQVEKSGLQRDIKRLESKIQYLQQAHQYYSKLEKTQQQVQTQLHFIKDDIINFDQSSDSFRNNEKIMTSRRSQKRSERKNRKRTTLKMQDFQRTIPLPKISSYQHQHRRQQSLQSNLPVSKDNIPLLEVNECHRTEARTKTFKLFTLNPSQQSSDTLIHRVSSRKLSPFKTKETQNNVPSATNSQAMSPAKPKKKMKKMTQNKLKHQYNSSQVIIRTKLHQKGQVLKSANIKKGQINRQNSTNMEKSHQQRQITAWQNKQNSKNIQIKITKHKRQTQQSINDHYRINQPVQQLPRQIQELSITEMFENMRAIPYPSLKQEMKRLLRFAISNYPFLTQRNIFSLLYDMRTPKTRKPEQRKCSKLICNEKIAKPQQIDTAVDVQCKKIGKRCIQIFFNMEQAQKYEKRIGIWQQYESFIIIDNNFSKQCQKIQQFFNNLKEIQPMLYQQAVLFLEKPFYFCQQIEGKDYQTKQITIFRESLRMFELQRGWIKRLFEKLLKLHKLLHKNCNHVYTFLNIIGFK